MWQVPWIVIDDWEGPPGNTGGVPVQWVKRAGPQVWFPRLISAQTLGWTAGGQGTPNMRAIYLVFHPVGVHP